MRLLNDWIRERGISFKLSWRFREMKIPDFILKLIGKTASKKIGLKEDTMENKDTKQWWKSKTILTAVVTVLIGVYSLVDTSLAPAFGFDLPAIPEWLFIILGSLGIYSRVVADKKIG